MIQAISIFVLTLWFSIANAAPSGLAAVGLQLNPTLKLKLTSPPGAPPVYRNGELEVRLHILALNNVSEARQVSQTEYLNIRHLFQPEKSPYRGQITKLVQCQKNYGPRESTVTLDGRKSAFIMGGANSRRQMGACARGEIDYWAGYFNYMTKKGDLVDVRILLPLKSPDSKQIHETSARLEKLSQKLFLDAK